jgi:hypothetical protein
MIYTDLDALSRAMLACDKDDPIAMAEFKRLFYVYIDAVENPPQFVIGVGAISYAQEMLVNAQLDNV